MAFRTPHGHVCAPGIVAVGVKRYMMHHGERVTADVKLDHVSHADQGLFFYDPNLFDNGRGGGGHLACDDACCVFVHR